jgi:hypothetical protein
MLQKWLEYKAAGLDVIPCGSESKNPGEHCKDWQKKVWDEQSIRDYYDRFPNDGIGVRLTGRVVDVEYDCGLYTAEEEVKEFLGSDSLITWSWKSARGVHRLFSIDEEQRQIFLAANVANRAKIGNLELHLGLTAPVFCVLPPTGVREWITKPGDCPVCNLPDPCTSKVAATGKPVNDFEQYEGPLRPGDELAMKLSWAEILTPHGWTRVQGTDGGKELWRRPGKTDGHSATVGHYCDEVTGEPKLHVFTDNAPPFTQGVSYDKFMAWTLLNHEGDFKSAASAAIEIINEEVDGSEFGPGVPSVPFVEDGTDVPVASPAAVRPELNPICFDNLFGEYAYELNDRFEAETDPVAVMAQAFEIFGCMLDRDVYFVTEEGPVYLNDYLMVVGTSGEGRKGTAWKHAKRLFELEQRYQDIIYGRVDSGEGLIKELDARQTAEFGGDTASMLIQDSEAAGLLSKMKIENSTLSQNLIKGWDCSAMSIAKSKERLVVKKPYVSLIGHIQPDVLKHQLDVQMLHSGLMNRIQFIYVERVRKNMFAQPMDTEHLTRYQERIAELLKNKPRGEMKFDKVGHEILNAFYNSDGNSARDHIHVMKNASRLAIIDGRGVISQKDVESAIAYQRYVKACRQYLLGNWGPDAELRDDAEKAVQFVMDSKDATRTDISNKLFRNNKSARELDAIIEYARKHLKLRSTQVKPKGRGRPKTVYAVN